METLVCRAYNHKINEGYIPNGVEIEPEIYDDKYKEITHKIDEEQDYIMQPNYKLSKSQSDKINKALKEYTDNIWLNKEEFDDYKVRKIIWDIIENGQSYN